MKGHSINNKQHHNIKDQNFAPNSTVSDQIKVSSNSTSGWS